jgi:DNA-binding IclR family transcriptional regulator
LFLLLLLLRRLIRNPGSTVFSLLLDLEEEGLPLVVHVHHGDEVAALSVRVFSDQIPKIRELPARVLKLAREVIFLLLQNARNSSAFIQAPKQEPHQAQFAQL